MLNDENKTGSSIKKIKKYYYIAAFVVFLAGIVIYLFFRDINNIILFRFFPKLPFLSALYIPIKSDSIWSYMLLYNLSDGLWCLSGLLLIRAIWLTNAKCRVIYFCIFIVMAFSLEISQMSESIYGTFDVLDLVFIVAFAFMESVIFIIFVKKKFYDEL